MFFTRFESGGRYSASGPGQARNQVPAWKTAGGRRAGGAPFNQRLKVRTSASPAASASRERMAKPAPAMKPALRLVVVGMGGRGGGVETGFAVWFVFAPPKAAMF